jgi:CheY-like chemotaxis protein
MLEKAHRQGGLGIYCPHLLFQDAIPPLVESLDSTQCPHCQTWKMAETLAKKKLPLPNLSPFNLKCDELYAIDYLLGEKRILAVEDNKVSMKLILKTLENLSTNVLTAENGQIAMDLIEEKGDVGLVLLDMQMPVMDGSAFIDEVFKCFDRLPFVVILVSELSNWEEAKRLIEMGVASSVKKPYKKDVFYHTILNSILTFNDGLPLK